MKGLISIIAGLLFLISFSAYIYIRLKIRNVSQDIDDIYYEFEDQDPTLAKYNRFSKITFALASISVLMLFLALIL